jgi:hypothetical protein
MMAIAPNDPIRHCDDVMYSVKNFRPSIYDRVVDMKFVALKLYCGRAFKVDGRRRRRRRTRQRPTFAMATVNSACTDILNKTMKWQLTT